MEMPALGFGDKKFIVTNLWWGPREFDSADAVAIFLWGKDAKHYKVFSRVDNLPADVDEIKDRLDHPVDLEKEVKDLKYLLDCKNDTANTFMNQVKKLQAENQALRNALDTVARYDEQPIWSDDRDDAADMVLEIARKALQPLPAKWRCRRCGAVVKDGRCRCEISPSPWEPV
jgi:hypothetical protein